MKRKNDETKLSIARNRHAAFVRTAGLVCASARKSRCHAFCFCSLGSCAVHDASMPSAMTTTTVACVHIEFERCSLLIGHFSDDARSLVKRSERRSVLPARNAFHIRRFDFVTRSFWEFVCFDYARENGSTHILRLLEIE